MVVSVSLDKTQEREIVHCVVNSTLCGRNSLGHRSLNVSDKVTVTDKKNKLVQ